MKSYIYFFLLFTISAPLSAANKTPEKTIKQNFKKHPVEQTQESSSSTLESPQKKRRLTEFDAITEKRKKEKEYQEQFDKSVQKARTFFQQVLKYQVKKIEGQKEFWSSFFLKASESSSNCLITTFCLYFPYTEEETVLLYILEQIKTLKNETKIKLLFATKQLFLRLFHKENVAKKYQEILVEKELTAAFPQETTALLELLQEKTTTQAVANQNFNFIALKELSREIKTFSKNNELKPILTKINAFAPLEQAVLISSHLIDFFKENVEEKIKSCDVLLEHLKNLILKTNDPLTLSIAAQIIARISFIGSSNQSPHQIVNMIIFGYTTLLAKQELSLQTKKNLLHYLSILQQESKIALTLTKKQSAKERSKKSNDLLTAIKALFKEPIETIIFELQRPKTKQLKIESGEDSILIFGKNISRIEYLFYSNGSQEKQQYDPEIQKELLNQLNALSVENKKRLIPKNLLWKHIIDNTVAIKFLEIIKNLPEEEQLNYLCPSDSPFKTWCSFNEAFYSALITRIESFSAEGKKRLLKSKLFAELFPDSSFFTTLFQRILEIIKKLPQDKLANLFKSEILLINYLKDYSTQDTILEYILTLPEKEQTKIFKIIFSMYEYDRENNMEIRFIKSIDQPTLEKILKTLQNASLKTKTFTLSKNEKALYHCIEHYGDGDIEGNALESLTKSLSNAKDYTRAKKTNLNLDKKITKIFSDLICRLLKKPVTWATKKEYLTHGSIPNELPQKIQYTIAQKIIDTINMIFLKTTPDSDEWVHQHYIINALINFLKNNATKNKERDFKSFWLDLEILHKKTGPLKKILTQFYSNSLITDGAKQLLEESNLEESPTAADDEKALIATFKKTAKNFDSFYEQWSYERKTAKKLFLLEKQQKLTDITFSFSS